MKQPTFWISVGVCGGVVAASVGSPLVAVVGLGVAMLMFRRAGRIVLIVALAAVVGIVRVWVSSLDPPPTDLAALAGQRVSAEGSISSVTVSSGETESAVASVSGGGRRGKTVLTVPRFPPLEPGDRVAIRGQPELPPAFDGFDYRSWLAARGIHTVMYRPDVRVIARPPSIGRTFFHIRQTFATRLEQSFPEPEASFLLGILIGDRTNIPDSLKTDFQRTGTSHVLALSGYNISVIFAVVLGLLGRRALGVWLAVGFIGAFVLLVGPSASVVRAALMGSLIVLGQLLGRPSQAIRICLMTGAAMLLANPWSARYDLGFDLSFLATLGILWLEPPLTVRLGWLPDLVRGPVATTVAATLATAPLIALSFGRISLISPVANLFVVPVIPWLMLGGFLTTLFGLAGGILAAPLAFATTGVTRLTLRTITTFSELPFSSFGSVGPRAIIFAATSLLAAAFTVPLLRRRDA